MSDDKALLKEIELQILNELQELQINALHFNDIVSLEWYPTKKEGKSIVLEKDLPEWYKKRRIESKTLREVELIISKLKEKILKQCNEIEILITRSLDSAVDTLTRTCFTGARTFLIRYKNQVEAFSPNLSADEGYKIQQKIEFPAGQFQHFLGFETDHNKLKKPYKLD